MNLIEKKLKRGSAPSVRSAVEPFRAMEVVAEANRLKDQGRDIIMMCVGQPAAPASKPVREAAANAASAGFVDYTSAGGLEVLRRRIAEHYLDHYGVEIDASRVFVTTGSSAGFVLSFLSLFDEGDRVAIPAPGYPAYRNILRALSLEPVEIQTTEATNWVLTPDLLRETNARSPIQGLLVANPNNPNGTMMTPEAFGKIIQTADQMNIRFISDEIYHGLCYAKREVTALKHTSDAIIINSFSKYYCMTGWRIGWMVVPDALIDVINRLQQNLFICAPQISQVAALAAFEGVAEMEEVKSTYVENAETVKSALSELGICKLQPIDGAFYAYFDVSPWLQATGALDAQQLAKTILDETGVALTPGADFDTERGGRWMRLSFACSPQRLDEGFARLTAWWKQQ